MFVRSNCNLKYSCVCRPTSLCVGDAAMADLKKLEEDAVSFAQQAIGFDQQGLHDMAFFYYCVSVVITMTKIYN